MTEQYRLLSEPSAHDKLFKDAIFHNLRSVDDQRIIYQLNTAGKTLFGTKQVKLTDMTGAYSQKLTATLYLEKDTRICARYMGSVSDGMGHKVSYELRVRTDVTVESKKQGLMAVAAVRRFEREQYIGASLFAIGQREHNEYDIYNVQWENNHRPPPKF